MGNLFRWQVGCGCGCDTFCEGGFCLYQSNLTGVTNFDNSVQNLGRDSTIAGIILSSNTINETLNLGIQAGFGASLRNTVIREYPLTQGFAIAYFDWKTQSYSFRGDWNQSILNSTLGCIFACNKSGSFMARTGVANTPDSGRTAFAIQTLTIDYINTSIEESYGVNYYQAVIDYKYNIAFTQTGLPITVYANLGANGFLPDIAQVTVFSQVLQNGALVPEITRMPAYAFSGISGQYYHESTPTSQYNVPYIAGMPYRNGVVIDSLAYPEDFVDSYIGHIEHRFDTSGMTPQQIQDTGEEIIDYYTAQINTAPELSHNFYCQPSMTIIGIANVMSNNLSIPACPT